MSKRLVDWLFKNFTSQTRHRRRRTQSPVAAQVELLESRILLSINLGTAETFAVLAGQAVTNTGPSTIEGDLGVSPGSAVTGFPPGSVTGGTIHASDAVAIQAQNDLTTAYNEAAGRAVTVDLTGQDLAGMTLTPGVYFFSSTAQLTGTLTLDAQGDPDAEFVFQIGSSLTTGSNSSVVMINGGDPCGVYWQVGSSATLGTNTAFVGHILALTSISLNTGATLDGSALARNGSVTLDDNVISVAGCMIGSISGQKFNDLNGDGVRQIGEQGLSGLTLYLDTNNNGLLDTGEKSTVSDANGNYTFDHLFAGTYRVRQVPQAGIIQTTPNPADVTLGTNDVVTGVDIGDFILDTIGGTKFQDTNGNGLRDIGETGLQGFTVYLDTNGNSVLDAGERFTVTDVNGDYSFANVGPGTYTVREVQQTGYTQTTTNPASIGTISGTNVSGINFGNFQLDTISGTKFLDTNGNAVRNPGEQGLQGFTVYLDTNGNSVLDAGERFTVTDVNGNYSFANVGPGTYTVREVQQTGYTQSTVNPAGIVTTSGTNIAGIDFGNFQLITIGGTKFQDTNGNGARDPGEVGLQGVRIFLDANNNGVFDSGERFTTTDVNGNYVFLNVGPGLYRVREVLPTGFTQTTVNPANIGTISGSNVSGINFGNFQLDTISGTKFLDTNGNAVRNPGEQGLQGFTVYLDANGNSVLDAGERFTVTDVNGNYSFANVGPGTYTVREVQQTGYTQSTVNPVGIVTTSGTNVGGIDFGNFQLITIGGTKFQDANSNGVRDPGEVGLQGFRIFLDANNNGAFDTGERFTTSDANGNYVFLNVGPGLYRVREVQQPGYTQTTVNPANIGTISGSNVTGIDFGNFFGTFQVITISGSKFLDTNGNAVRNPGEQGLQGFTVYLDANGNSVLDAGERFTVTDVNGNYSFTNVGPGTYTVREVQQTGYTQSTVNPASITAVTGTNVAGVDFGNFQLIIIGGTKFQDTNGNGVRDTGELGLQGVRIFLDANNNGVFDSGERFTTTDVNGNYVFLNVGPGLYRVREVLPPGFTQTTVNPANIGTISGTNVAGINFGNFQLIIIGGTKFQDTNGNGLRDPGELGLQGFTVYLDANGNNVLDAGERFTVTDINGNYSFTNVGPGTYRVREVQQAGFTQTTVNPGDIAAISGSDAAGINFGNFQLIIIGGTKFQDTNGNGLRDAGEPGLQGFTIYLDANNNHVLDAGETSTVSDINGNFSFTNLAPGSYRVREVIQTNYVKMTNDPATILAASGGNVTTITFGNMPVSNLFVVSKLALTGNNLNNYLNGTFGRQANYVANLYETLLGRAPDLNGLTYYVRMLMAGYNQTQVTAAFKVDNHLAA